MSARRKALFAVCCFVPLVVYGVGIAALAAGGIEHDPLRNAFLGFTYVGMAIYIVGMVAAILHVARREDFDGRRRTKWLLLILRPTAASKNVIRSAAAIHAREYP